MKKERTRVERSLKRSCSACGTKMQLLIFDNRTYTGGHYFGKIPLFRKKELERASRAGTQKKRMHGVTIHVMKQDSKPYTFKENWECERCYQKAWMLEKKYAHR